jgi:hypothetical protein
MGAAAFPSTLPPVGVLFSTSGFYPRFASVYFYTGPRG